MGHTKTRIGPVWAARSNDDNQIACDITDTADIGIWAARLNGDNGNKLTSATTADDPTARSRILPGT